MIYQQTDSGVLYCGDCLEILPTLEVKAELILCDLPYGTTACKWDVIIPFEPLWMQYKRITKDNRAIVLTASQPFTSALVMSNLKMFKYELIWEKEQGTNQNLCSIMPLKCHENILVFGDGKILYNPQFSKGLPYTVNRKNKVESDPIIGVKQLRTNTVNNGLRYPVSIIYATRELSERYHPTQKPVSLFGYLIKTYTNEGELVLDNCAGSGTTAIACIRYNRRYILIEKEEKYCEIAAKRIESELAQGVIEL